VSSGFLDIFWQNRSFVALHGLSAFYYHFTDDAYLYGTEKPVAVNPMILILLLLNKNSAFSTVDTEIQLIRVTQVTQHH